MINNIRSILKWYDFKNNNIYFVEKDIEVDSILKTKDLYEYIVIYNDIKLDEYILKQISKCLTKTGKLIIVARNKLSIKNFCTAKQRGYTLSYINKIINNIGFKVKRYYPFPSMEYPEIIYTDKHKITKNDLWRIINCFPDENEMLINEYSTYMDLIENELLPKLNNAVIFECSFNRDFAKDNYVTQTLFRKKKYAFITKLTNKEVIKKPIFKEGLIQLKEVIKNTNELNEKGINVVSIKENNRKIYMEFIDKPMLSSYIKDENVTKEETLNILDKLWDVILQSSEIIENNFKYGPILKKAYIELIPLNTFYENEEFLFFDQEFVYENTPAKYVLFRAIKYLGIYNDSRNINIEELKNIYELNDIWDKFEELELKNWNSWYIFETKTNKYNLGVNNNMIENHRKFAQDFFEPQQDSKLLNRLKLTKELSIDLLEVVANICKKNNIKWYPIFGTLLGAIRHKKMIPWDDDIDIAMDRIEYEKFIEICKNQIKEGYELYVPSEKESMFNGGYIRFINKNTIALEEKNYGKYSKDGFWIDVFPLDKCYENEYENIEKLNEVRKLQKLIYCKTYEYDEDIFEFTKDEYNKYKSCNTELKKLYKKLNQELIKGNEKSNKIGIFTNMTKKGYFSYLNQDFEEDKIINFEGIEIIIPKGYDNILKESYKSKYMKWPKFNNRYPHHNYFLKKVPYKNYHNRLYDLEDKIKDKEVIIFGAGYMSLNFLNKYNNVINVNCILDNDKNKWNKKLKEITLPKVKIEEKYKKDVNILNTLVGEIIIKNPEQVLKENLENKIVVICSYYFKEIENQIRKMGVKDNYYIYVQDKKWIF